MVVPVGRHDAVAETTARAHRRRTAGWEAAAIP
jgi:hypothetical protein